MHGKPIISVFIVVIIVIFAYYILVLQPQSFVDPIDPNNEFEDYRVLENTADQESNILSYRVIGQIEEITNDELKIRTVERVLTIKKPEATEYIAFIPAVTIDETQLQQNGYVRATVSVDKTTNEVVKLSVTVIGMINQDEEFEHLTELK
jgi:hypothetical protein|tara:strand:+ start:377 stop:826 length:450 start_codon:yes stop_codon:yes gene_type:complete